MDYKSLNTSRKKKFWIENPIRGEVIIEIEGLPKFTMYCDNDDTVVKELYWTNFEGWEPFSLQLWSKLASKGREGLVLDIGSYSGIYGIIASKLNKTSKIIAFDIQEKCITRIKKNFEINQIDNASVIHAACSDMAGTVEFYFYEEKDVISSVASIFPKSINTQSASINSIVLDSFLYSEVDYKLSLVKIDVEGAEKKVLAGLSKTIKKHNPDFLIEINHQKEVIEVLSLFPSGYHYFNIDEDSFKLRGKSLLSKKFKHRNYLFTTRSKAEVMKILNN